MTAMNIYSSIRTNITLAMVVCLGIEFFPTATSYSQDIASESQPYALLRVQWSGCKWIGRDCREVIGNEEYQHPSCQNPYAFKSVKYPLPDDHVTWVEWVQWQLHTNTQQGIDHYSNTLRIQASTDHGQFYWHLWNADDPADKVGPMTRSGVTVAFNQQVGIFESGPKPDINSDLFQTYLRIQFSQTHDIIGLFITPLTSSCHFARSFHATHSPEQSQSQLTAWLGATELPERYDHTRPASTHKAPSADRAPLFLMIEDLFGGWTERN